MRHHGYSGLGAGWRHSGAAAHVFGWVGLAVGGVRVFLHVAGEPAGPASTRPAGLQVQKLNVSLSVPEPGGGLGGWRLMYIDTLFSFLRRVSRAPRCSVRVARGQDRGRIGGPGWGEPNLLWFDRVRLGIPIFLERLVFIL